MFVMFLDIAVHIISYHLVSSHIFSYHHVQNEGLFASKLQEGRRLL